MSILHTVIQRRYPDNNWDYKAISTQICGKSLIYYTLNSKEGFEVYAGANYVAGSKERSYSRNYAIDVVPAKYRSVLVELRKIHKETVWSNEAYVDSN